MRPQPPMVRPYSALTAGLIVASVTGIAHPASAAATTPARAPASGGQSELVVGFDAKGSLHAAVCATPGCPVDAGAAISLPDAVAGKRAQAKLTLVAIGERRHAIHVMLAGDVPGQAWQAVVVAKPGQPNPEIVFQGMTGYVEGEEGLRHGPSVEVSEPVDDTGVRRILIGEQREDLTLCGRPAVLSPKMLVARELLLKPAKVQRLSADEREHATKLTAEPRAAEPSTAPNQPNSDKTGLGAPGSSVNGAPAAQTPQPPTVASRVPTASLLRAIGATSAVGWPASLTDGDVETTWAENRGGSGRGEFVSFRAPSDVPLQGFDFVVRPRQREIKNGVGPERLWLVTDKQLFLVTFPSDPWKAPGVTWKVALPTPVQTSCVAVVTETAYGEKPDAEVTLAEVAAHSEFTAASIENLVGALAGGGPRADAAGTVLASLGPDAFVAVSNAFDSLDEGGRRVALDVLDHAPCSDSAPIYIDALLGKVEAHRLHALDRLRRCGVGSIGAIESRLSGIPAVKLQTLAELLADVAPDKALRLLVPRLLGSAKMRRALRDVIGKAARSPKAHEAIADLLKDPQLPNQAAIDLLRALGRQVTDYADDAAASLERLLGAGADFRTKFLLLGPAHLVCDKRPALVKTVAGLMRADPNPALRAEATRQVVHFELYANELYQALEDPAVRVRQAAAQSLAEYKRTATITALSKRLKHDEWPLVRVAAAQSLANQPTDSSADKALVEALADGSWLVKTAAVESVATRKVLIAGEPLLELFTEKKERSEVRIAAARALGDICYDRAVDKLTEQAKTLRAPSPDPNERAIASVALDALAKIHPSDLAARLEPMLRGKDTPAGTQQAARAALATQPHCHVPALTTASNGGN